MLKSYKYRIYPNDTQKEQLQRFFGVSRLVYNIGLETKTTAYIGNKVSVSKYDLMRQATELRNEFDYIKECPSQVLQQKISDLDVAYTNFFKKRGSYPKFKNKYAKQSIRFPQGVKLDFDKNTIKFPKLGNIDIVISRIFKGKVKSVTLSKTNTNKYFVSILVDTEINKPKKAPIKEDTTIGVDLGIKDFAITSKGKHYPNLNFQKSLLKRLRIEQRSLARKQKDSNNREKQRLAVAKLQEKIRNQRIDYLHKVSTELIKENDTIVLEDLNVSGMMKNHNLSRAIGDMGWREFRTILEYKTDWYGKNILFIGRFDPSSKICSNCGSIKKDLKLSDRIYHCDNCGHSEDRDVNASKNIKKIGLRTQPLYANVRQ